LTCGGECFWHRSFGRLHPFFELTLLEQRLAVARLGLEDLLLTGGLEIASDRLLKRRLVLHNKPTHTVELLYSPLATARYASCEVTLLTIE
jgi:hypothetical protein